MMQFYRVSTDNWRVQALEPECLGSNPNSRLHQLLTESLGAHYLTLNDSSYKVVVMIK